jgi:signal peptidase I
VTKRLSRLLWVIFAALALRACVLEPVRITDDSMAPRLREGDVVLVFKLQYGLRIPGAGAIFFDWSTPRKGDLVVAVGVGDPPVNILREITSEPGETFPTPEGPAKVEEDQFFLMAKQAEGVVDSRRIGLVNRRAIIGKATHIWFSKKPSTDEGSKVESAQAAWRVLQPLL